MNERRSDACYTGGCLCGAVRYAAERFEPEMAHCHCSMCRRFHGAAYATFGRVRREHFRWLSGEDRLRAYRADNGTVRRFCADCGSSLSFAPANDDGRYVEVALGTLDGELEQHPDAHIFIGSKANWVEPCDGLPQYVEDRRGPRADG